MSIHFILGLCALLSGLFFSSIAFAVPPIWEADFGPAITSLTATDDGTDSVVLSFDFPFDGVSYRTIFVGANGELQLGSLGLDGDIDYDHWEYMEELTADEAPSICGFGTDLDLSGTGTIHFNDFGDRAVFTWNEVGTNANELALSTFQISLYPSGRILIGWNGILDGANEDLLDDLNEGIVVGVTAGDIPQPTNPDPIDLSVATVGGTTMFGRWCYDTANSCGTSGDNLGLPGPVNLEFDLDDTNVDFIPVAGGFSIGGPELGNLRLRCEDDSTTGGCRLGYLPTSSVGSALTEFVYRIEAGASPAGANDFDQQLILSPPGSNLTLEWSDFIGQLGVRIFAGGGETQFFVPGFQWTSDTDYQVEIETNATNDTYAILIDGELLVEDSLGADFETLDRITFRSALPTTGAFQIDDVAISPLAGGADVLLDTFSDEIVGSPPLAPDIGSYSGNPSGLQTVISVPEPGSVASGLIALSTVGILVRLRRRR